VPTVIFHRDGQTWEGEVKVNANLVVMAGIRQFPFPHLRYGCGMGKCCKCASRVLGGAEHLPEPNWKEKKQLGPRLEEGYRLICQIWITRDVELEQDRDPLQPAGATQSVQTVSTPRCT
jgi:ferredoxin